jgi:hypothetical protein
MESGFSISLRAALGNSLRHLAKACPANDDMVGRVPHKKDRCCYHLVSLFKLRANMRGPRDVCSILKEDRRPLL